MTRGPPGRTSPGQGEEADRFGFEQTTRSPGSFVSSLLGRFVPPALARRAIRASIETDKQRYDIGDEVAFTAEFYNPLPVAVAVETRGRRLWGWTVDGNLEASDEPRYAGDKSRTIRFGARERKRVRRTWDGTFKRTGDLTRWVDPEPGEHELAVFLAVTGDRPEARTTIRFE